MTITNNIDCSLNITKRREQVFYNTTLPTEVVGIAFASSNPLTSDDNLSIVDRSTSLLGNRIQNLDYTTEDSISVFTIDTDSFLVTDVFVTEDNTISPEPLFYQHTISLDQLVRTDPDNYDFSLSTGYKLVSVEILDSAFQAVKITEKLIDYDTGIIYSNIETEYNSTIDYTIYYIRYTFNTGSEVKTLTELLSNTPVYRIADYDDLDELLQIISDGRKVYLLEDEGTYFSVTLPSTNTYSYKPLSNSRIKILPPVSSNSTESWFTRITNGKFFQTINSELYKYYIAEFLTQTFNPSSPIKRIQLEESTILSKSLIKLDREDIYEDETESLYLDIQISKADGIGVAAYTTNLDQVGEIADNGIAYIKWNTSNRVGIRSIDYSLGLLDIEGLTLKSTWVVTSNYYFKETNYEFTTFNFNPISNNDALSHKIVLFIEPETDTTLDQSLYYLKVDQSDKVVESNWTDFDNDTQAHIDSLPIYYENYPDYLTATTHYNFIDDFSVETSGVNDYNFLILGDITTAEAQHADEVVTFDSRKRGGGIKASSVEELISSNLASEVQWCWDEGFWDGIPYPGNASYLIEVPVDILDGIDQGIFNQAQIREITSRHTAAGVYPIIRAYGVNTIVSGIVPTMSGIMLNWYSNGFGY